MREQLALGWLRADGVVAGSRLGRLRSDVQAPGPGGAPSFDVHRAPRRANVIPIVVAPPGTTCPRRRRRAGSRARPRCSEARRGLASSIRTPVGGRHRRPGRAVECRASAPRAVSSSRSGRWIRRSASRPTAVQRRAGSAVDGDTAPAVLGRRLQRTSSTRHCTGCPRSRDGSSMRSKSRGTIGVGEHRARLVAQLAAGVARRECVSASSRPRPRSRARRPARAVECRVSRARSASSSVKVASWTSRSAPWRRRASCRTARCRRESTSLRPRRGSPMHLLGPHAVDRLAALEAPKSGPGVTPSSRCLLGVEAARAARPRQRVAERRHAVVDREGRDPVAVALELLVGLQLDQASSNGVAAPTSGAQRRRTARLQAARPVDGERPLALAQPEGLEHARQAEHSGRRGSG